MNLNSELFSVLVQALPWEAVDALMQQTCQGILNVRVSVLCYLQSAGVWMWSGKFR